MKSYFYKELKKRRYFKSFELEKIRIKSILFNNKLSFSIRSIYFQKWHSYPRNTSISRLKNRCFITCSGRSVYRQFGVNRITLREMMGQGIITGLIKSSW